MSLYKYSCTRYKVPGTSTTRSSLRLMMDTTYIYTIDFRDLSIIYTYIVRTYLKSGSQHTNLSAWNFQRIILFSDDITTILVYSIIIFLQTDVVLARRCVLVLVSKHSKKMELTTELCPRRCGNRPANLRRSAPPWTNRGQILYLLCLFVVQVPGTTETIARTV